MTQFENVPRSLLSRLTALIAGTIFLTPAVSALAQQSVLSADRLKDTHVTKKETNINKLATASGAAAEDAIRPFRVNFPKAALDDLRQRVAATRWPDQETVTDQSQGVQLATMKKLIKYWQTDYDWRKMETKLNSYPQFITTIDGVDIHFIHVKSRNANALPIIITHGWPGSIIEQLKIIGPLTDPTAYGGRKEDSFDVVIPSLPGYGF